jgi:iron complex transport system ATP-binding protein
LESVLTVEAVSFRYRKQWVLRGVGFAVRRGEILGILGPNAAGKTTLVRLMDGIVRPQKGRIRLEGMNLARMSRSAIARRIAVVPQESPLLYAFTGLEVVLMGRSAHLPRLGFEGLQDLSIARASLEKTGCGHLWNRSVNELSGGERQRVLIARALAQEPRLLLLDEPTVYLDLRYQLDFLELVLELNRVEGITIVWVSHDLNLASLSCHRILLMKEGEVAALGTPAEVLTGENIEKVYGRRVMVDRNPQLGIPRVTPLLGSTNHTTRGASR